VGAVGRPRYREFADDHELAGRSTSEAAAASMGRSIEVVGKRFFLGAEPTTAKGTRGCIL
jgi:hypothetical protein